MHKKLLKFISYDSTSRINLEVARAEESKTTIHHFKHNSNMKGVIKQCLVSYSMDKNQELIKKLKDRFDKNINLHRGIQWEKIHKKLEAKIDKLGPLHEMERTGGEPDVVGYDEKTDEYIFYDCSAESPKGRRSLCYDRAALDSRKEFKPKNSAVNMAEEMGIEILTEEQYRELQKLGIFDVKTSSWVKTPLEIRKLGGACFCDRRYNHVFTYHNGAESYYASRGFRGFFKL